METPRYLVEYTKRCEPRLKAFLDEKRAQLSTLPVPFPFEVLAEYVLRGGKRLRGALVELAGGTLDASVGVELLHAYLLIHDDFMDRDEVRRGGPTVHVALGNDHRAASLAVLLGSLAEAWAYELVLKAPHGLEAAAMLTQALQEVIVGQALDIEAPRHDLKARQILHIEQLKTGSYTFELPLKLGAIIAGKPNDTYDAYARPLGQAFQIADDILGTFGDPAVTGKANASDLREGKRTLLFARAIEARPALRQETNPDVLRKAIVETGALKAAQDEAERLLTEALSHTDDPRLREIAHYAIRRSA